MAEAHDALEGAMDAARVDLGWKWTKVAERMGGMSPQNLFLIRKGSIAITDRTARLIEKAFDWPPGRVRELRPVDKPRTNPNRTSERPPALREPLTERDLRDVTERAIWEVDEASEDARWAAVFKYRVRLAREYGVQLQPGDEKWG